MQPLTEQRMYDLDAKEKMAQRISKLENGIKELIAANIKVKEESERQARLISILRIQIAEMKRQAPYVQAEIWECTDGLLARRKKK